MNLSDQNLYDYFLVLLIIVFHYSVCVHYF